MVAPISPEAVIAIEVLKAQQEGRKLEIEDISRHFLELQSQAIPLRPVSLRTVPDGVYSDDVEAFVGRLLAAGYARARSPIDFRPDGLRICRSIVEGEYRRNPKDLRALAQVMDFDLSTVMDQVS
jgi:hypothetical protein